MFNNILSTIIPEMEIAVLTQQLFGPSLVLAAVSIHIGCDTFVDLEYPLQLVAAWRKPKERTSLIRPKVTKLRFLFHGHLA
jgi:hypothetical protein